MPRAAAAASASQQPRSRGPGRPRRGPKVASPDVREKLVRTATDLFAAHSFGEVGIRRIARAAGVTPGMIAYYFGGKLGLLEAVLDGFAGRVLGGLEALAKAPPAGGAPAVETVVRLYVSVLAADPRVAQVLVREVLSRDTPMRQRFIERFGARVAQALPRLVEREIEAGRLQRGLDPVDTAISLVGMLAFPFLAQPVLGRVFGLEIDEAFGERWIAHTTRVFLDGVRGEQRS